MKRYLIFLISAAIMLTYLPAYSQNYTDTAVDFSVYTPLSREDIEDAEFDDGSVMAVVRQSGSRMSLYSMDYSLKEFGISEVKNLDRKNSSVFSLFSTSDNTAVYKFTLEEPGRENVIDIIEKLNEQPYIEYAEPNYIYRLFDTPNDYYYASKQYQYNLDNIGAKEVWNMNDGAGISCKDISIAIIDSGVATNHPDLADNIWKNPDELSDGIDNDGNGYIDDINGWDFAENDIDPYDGVGHGTHVAGIASAVTNNSIGVASLARDAKIVPLRIFGADGKTTNSWTYEAVCYVRDKKIPVANMSFGGPEKSKILEDLIRSCTDTVFVVASGNSTLNIDNDKYQTIDGVYTKVSPVYPAAYDCENIISIASSDENDKLSSFSNYGVKNVDICVPGNNIYSTYYKPSTDELTYAKSNGTSMACPLAASAAAVIRARFPQMSPVEVIAQMESTADVIDGLGEKVKTGARLNAYKALFVKAESISLDKISMSVYTGDKFSLTQTVTPSYATDSISWESSDESVAAVKDGEVTAVGGGTATITVTAGDEKNVSASCEVTVINPTAVPTVEPTAIPTAAPTVEPTAIPTVEPTAKPTATPTAVPTAIPTVEPTAKPTATPTAVPTAIPTVEPTATPTVAPTAAPTATPTVEPTAIPTIEPTAIPTVEPTAIPTVEPTATPTVVPTATPTAVPTAEPTAAPTAIPTVKPTVKPTAVPTVEPTAIPTVTPTVEPTAVPTETPTAAPTATPTVEPTAIPTATPTVEPTAIPTAVPTEYGIKYENGKAIITAPKAGVHCVIFAAFKDGTLVGIEAAEAVFETAGEITATPLSLNTDGADSVKVMLWSSVKDMKPLCKMVYNKK